MATLSTLDFEGGTNNTAISESGWSTHSNTGPTPRYINTDAAHGSQCMECVAGQYANIGRNVTGLTEWRLDFYFNLVSNATQSSHQFLVSLMTGTFNAAGPQNMTYGGDISVRNVDGGKIVCRWNYDSSSIAASAFPEDTWVRMGLHWSSAAGMTLYVYESGDDSTVDYTLSDADAAGASITGVWLGLENSTAQIHRFDSVRFTEGEDPGPYSASSPVDGVATYDRTDTYATDQDDYANATYQIDATGSTGSTTLVQQSGTTAAPSESPTGVFTITDPGGTDTLTYLLTAAGVDGGADDTETINISRGAGTVERPVVYTFQGGDHASAANWT